MNVVPRNPASLLIAFLLLLSPLRAADIAWDGGGDGVSFSDGANWGGDRVPGGGDHAIIAQAGSYTVRLTADLSLARLTLGGGSGGQTLDATGFSLTLGTDSSTVGTNGLLILGGASFPDEPVLTINGPLLVQGRVEWTNGMLYANTYYQPPNGRVITIAPGGTMLMRGAGERHIGATLDNQGTLRWEEGLTWYDQGYAHSSSGEFQIDLDTAATFRRAGVNSVGPWIFTNTGTIRKTGPGMATLQFELRTIGGTVDVREGTLLQNYTSRWERASVSVAAGATLHLGANRMHEPHTVADTLRGTIDGTFLLSGLSWGYNTVMDADPTTGGAIDLGGSGLQVDYGELGGVYNSTTRVYSPAPVNLGFLHLLGGNEKTISGAFVNRGRLRWESGTLIYHMTASFRNEGLFEIALDTTALFRTGGINGIRPGPFMNVGRVVKSGRGRANVTVDFYTIGTRVEVRQGMLVQGAHSRWEDATIEVDSGATLRLDGYIFDMHVIAGTLRGDPSGTFLASGLDYGYYTLLVADTVRGGRLEIGGTGLQLGDNEIGSGNGWPAPVNGGLVRFVGGLEQGINDDFRNEGTVLWESGNLLVKPGVTLTNAGLMEIRTHDNYFGFSSCALLNDTGGTVRKIDTGKILLRGNITNRGRFMVGTGMLTIENGSNQFISETGGIISGRGVLDLNQLPADRLHNRGIVAPGPGDAGEGIGTLVIHGPFPYSDLELELGGTDSALYDRLIVSANTPDLSAVTAYISLANGFVPVSGNWFDVVTGSVANELLDVIETNSSVALRDTYPGSGVRLVVGDVVTGETMIDLIAPMLAARQGEEVIVPITVVATPGARSRGATEVNLTLRFNATLLGPIESTPRGRIETGERIIDLRIPLDASRDTTILPLRFRATLGNDSITPLAISNAVSNAAGITPRLFDGSFTLLDLCREGGTRLLNPDGVVAMSKARPNPVSGRLSFDLDLTEHGTTTIVLRDLRGDIIRRFIDDELPRGSHAIDLDLRGIPGGRYFITVTTPTMHLFQQVEVVR